MNNTSTLVNVVACAAQSILKQVPIFAVCSDTYKQFQETKFEYFLNEVKIGAIEPNINLLNDYDVLHSAYLTQLALLKIRQKEKIKLFASLFVSYFNKVTRDYSKISCYSDEYEQLINIIEPVSIEEWEILIILHKQELLNKKMNIINNATLLITIDQHWDSFLIEVKHRLNLDKAYVEAILTKLNGTGLYQTITGMYLGYTGNKGYLTPIYYKLIGFLNCQ